MSARGERQPGTRAEWDDARRVGVVAVEAAGAMLRARLGGHVDVRAKGTAGDVVTDLDLAAESLVIERLRAAYPTHRIVAEESGLHGIDHGRTWLLDPLDGSNNLAIGLPLYVVGLALCAGRCPVVGVVHDPLRGHTWSAVRGGGALGPAGPLRPVARPTPAGPVLAWTQGYQVARTDPTARALKLALDDFAYRVLRLWAPLLCWTMLARGDIDGFVGYRPEAIDLPAGQLIAVEAGLVVYTLDGVPFDGLTGDLTASLTGAGADRRSFVAGHPDRIGELLEVVRAARDGVSR